MAYTTKKQFQLDYAKAAYGDNMVEKAWLVYQNAFNNLNGFCLMGRINDRGILCPVEADIPKFEALKRDMNFTPTNTEQAGNVLILPDDSWSIGVNDAWVLGGIHSKSTFCLFKEGNIDKYDLKKEIINSYNSNKITVTGREIFGLYIAGYKMKLAFGQLVFLPPTSVGSFTFKGYVDAIACRDNVKYIIDAFFINEIK